MVTYYGDGGLKHEGVGQVMFYPDRKGRGGTEKISAMLKTGGGGGKRF